MAKSLVNKLRKGALIVTAVSALGFATCKNPAIPPVPNENNPPVITSTPVTEVNEEQQYNYDVDAEDQDGDSLEYSLIQKPSWLDISSDGNINGIAPSVDNDTNFQVVVKVSDNKDFCLQNYNLRIKDVPVQNPDYVDISGKLEDNENGGAGRQGIIKIYDPENLSSPLRAVSTDSNGDFSFTLDELVSELPNGIVIQARIGQPGNYTSYVRTIDLPSGDHNPITDSRGDPAIRAVPYEGLSTNAISAEDFRAHMDEVNFLNIPNFGLFKYDISNVQIIKENPFVNASFSNPEINFIKNKIQDINDIRVYIEGEELNINETLEKHYDEDFTNKIITPHNGWIIVIPALFDTIPPYIYENDTEIPYAGATYNYNSGLPQVWGKSKILLYLKTDPVVSHEFGHALAFPYHASTLFDESIMYESPTLSNPSFADKKASKIIYEDTYRAKENLDDVMGMKFLDEP